MSLQKPLVSIVMPAYNVEEYICKSIESVVSQTYDNWELIIINDGSTDDTEKKVELYSDQRIFIYSQVNRGVSVARNEGIKKAKGEYIAFLDADDHYDPNFLYIMLAQILVQNADLVFCKYKKIQDGVVIEQTPLSATQLPNNSFAQYLLNVKNNAYAVMATIYRMDLIRKLDIYFTENCILGEDSEFMFKCASVGKAAFVSEYLYSYIYRSNSASHSALTYKHLHDYIGSYDRAAIYISQNGISDVSLYLEYIKASKNGVLINFKRKLWKDLKLGHFHEVERQLAIYGDYLYHPSRNIFQKVGNTFKFFILNSKNLKLWGIINKLFAYKK